MMGSTVQHVTLLMVALTVTSAAGRCVGADVRDNLGFGGPALPQVANSDVTRYSNPLRETDPREFWSRNRRVYQKRGILIEDEDYVVKQRWWELDSRSVGRVVETRSTDRGWVVQVLFTSAGGWQLRTFDKQLESVTVEDKSVKITRQGYDVETVALTFKVNGVAVDKSKCGLVIRREGDAAYVEFPAELLSYELPRMNERVMRGPDWFDGYADGGNAPFGALGGHGGACLGTVVEERNDDGNITVRWDRTGRTSVYRFDNRQGFCDIEKVADAEQQ